MPNAQQKCLCQPCSCVPHVFKGLTEFFKEFFLSCNTFSFHKGIETFLGFWYNFMTLKISLHDFSIHASFLLAMPAVLLFVAQDPLCL